MIETLVSLVCGVLLVAGGGAFWRLYCVIHLFHRRKRYSTSSMLKELPSVTVCIPARNERHAMTQCLDNVLSSSYPKLEVIVCDDSSVDGTSNLIKAFARDGVRFVEGSPPQAGWLGKNNALDALLKESSGTYVLFLDVDTVLSPSSIGQMVAYAKAAEASMVSILPLRRDMLRASVFFAPLRYFWRLVFHSRTYPAVASSAWMINRRDFLASFGDFSDLKAAIEPEVNVARHFAVQHAYRFLISYDLLGVSYQKKLSSQIETSVRLRFPALGASYVRTGAALVGIILLLMAPVVALLSELLVLQLLGGGVILTSYACYYYYLRVVWTRGALFGALLYPAILMIDAVILLGSAFSYTRGTVTWKGRPVSLEKPDVR